MNVMENVNKPKVVNFNQKLDIVQTHENGLLMTRQSPSWASSTDRQYSDLNTVSKSTDCGLRTENSWWLNKICLLRLECTISNSLLFRIELYGNLSDYRWRFSEIPNMMNPNTDESFQYQWLQIFQRLKRI